MTILVTGCSGFVGSNLCERLCQNNIVLGIDREDLPHDMQVNENFSFYQVDLLRGDLEDILKKVDFVIHLAASAGVKPSCDSPLSYCENNILVTLRLLDLCAKMRIKYFTYASSSTVYGNDCNIESTRSTDSLLSPYAITKKSVELFCDWYARQYDMKIVGFRLFSVYGPRCRKDMAPYKFINAILNDEPIYINGDGSLRRDFTYVTDVIDGILSSLDYIVNMETNHEIFNLGNASDVSINNFIEMIETLTQKKSQRVYSSELACDSLITSANLTKSHTYLNYYPKVSLADGLKNTITYISKI
jgi:UDP-glucuronate 4-epimerase